MPVNLVYLHSHDTGRYVQPYGYAVPTPRYQRFAEEGVVFRQAFCANPTCSPSRAALLTGQWAHSCGQMGLTHRGFPIQHPERLLGNVLKGHGYETALAGIQHVVKKIPQAGYERNLLEEWAGDAVEARAVRFLESKPKRPFFLDVGFHDTHRGGPVPGGFPEQPAGELPTDPRWLRPPAPFPDEARTREDFALYVNTLRSLDRKAGLVLDALDRAGLRENTLVLITTDHGIAFPRMKCHLTDHGLGVLLMLRGPGGWSGGKVLDAMVSQIDVVPTLCEALEVPKPGWLQGHSLYPLLRGEKTEIREELFGEVNFHAAYEPKRAVRTKRWKYIRRFDKRERDVMPNCDDAISKDLFVERGWRELPVERERLFDLTFDPHETHNLAGLPACDKVLGEMRGRLARWMKETGDPLLEREVLDAPEDAVVTDTDGFSPGKDPKHPAKEWLAEKFG